jgi:hypothetical protein
MREAFRKEASDPELVLERLGQAPLGPQSRESPHEKKARREDEG